ncbi:MAG: methionyl-tRNA formyltransferase [Actinobacteria bacterium]|nr:methionyl-tRNA formyltransferase [Actinomycetota bacterium]
MPSSAPSGAALPTRPRHPRRLVYLGTPKMAVPPLHALCDAGFEVALVVTGADKRRGRRAEPSPTPVKLAAIERGLPVSHDLADVPGAGADLGVVVAYGRILRRELLEVLPMVNLHFSLLPRWRGAAPVERALLAGDQRTGVCVMAVEEGLDTGGVYARADLAIRRTSTAAELGGQLTELGSALLVDALRTGLGEPEPQVGEPTYAAKLGTDDLRLRWARPAAELDRLVRVGGAWTTFRGRRLKVGAARPWPADGHGGRPGELRDDRVVTGDGLLQLVEVQPEGRQPTPFASWANGARPADGELLGEEPA